MKRPVVLIVGAAAGALILAAVGASAHTGLFPTKMAGLNAAVAGDEASGARETPEPTETPEVEPTETPEPADTDTDADETETNDDTESGSGSSPKSGGEHEGSGTGGGGHDD